MTTNDRYPLDLGDARIRALVDAEPKRPRREWPRHYEYRWKVA